MFFLERELEYATSVKQLVEVGQFASTAIIARTMLEGAACLHWVMESENPWGRAVKWNEFVYHESLKALDEREPADKDLTNIYTIKREAQKLKEIGKSFKERRWTTDEQGRVWSAREILQEFVESEHHKKFVYAHYQDLSAFVHWSPKAFPVSPQKLIIEELVITKLPEGFVLTTVATARLSLLSVVIFVDNHFNSPQGWEFRREKAL